jgi:hypothetical protein
MAGKGKVSERRSGLRLSEKELPAFRHKNTHGIIILSVNCSS